MAERGVYIVYFAKHGRSRETVYGDDHPQTTFQAFTLDIGI